MTIPTFDIAGGQILGDREAQEDAFFYELFANQRAAICALADGMGGHTGGKVAAELVVGEFVRGIREEQMPVYPSFVHLLEVANRKLADRVESEPELEGMGCTFIGLEVIHDQFRWISVGDSLVLHVRGNSIKRVNKDHSMASRIDKAAERGEISWEEAKASKSRHVLLSAVTGGQLTMVDVPVQPSRIGTSDMLIIATDGIETLEQDEIQSIALENRHLGASAITHALLDAVKARGKRHQDNTTVITVCPLGKTREDNDLDDIPTRPVSI